MKTTVSEIVKHLGWTYGRCIKFRRESAQRPVCDWREGYSEGREFLTGMLLRDYLPRVSKRIRKLVGAEIADGIRPEKKEAQ